MRQDPGRAEGDGEAGRDRRHGAVDQDPAAAGLDPRHERLEERLPGASRVAEQLDARLAPLELPAGGELVPQPRHRDVLGARAELAPQQRPPDLLAGLPRPSRAAPRPPRSRPRRARPRAPRGGPLEAQHRDAHPHPRAQRERREAQQVERPGERPRAPVEEERHRRRPPLELLRHPELVVERGDLAVAREEVVVVALQAGAVAQVERRGLPAEPGPALVDVAHVARLGEAVGGPARPSRRRRRRPSPDGPLRVVGPRPVDVLAHHVERAALDLVVDAPDVLADDPEGHELDAADQQDDEQQRRDAALVDAGVAGDDGQRQERERERAKTKPSDGRDLQRDVGERRDPVPREAHHPPQRELRRPAGAGVAVVLDDRGLEAHPRRHAAQEAVALAQPGQRVDDLAVEQPEVARVGLERDLREPPHERVEAARGDELEARLAAAHPPLGDHHVDPLPPALHELRDDLGRVLQVAVDDHDGVAAGVVEAGGDRELVAERAREVQHAHAGVGGRDPVEDLGRPVGRAVVDDDELEREAVQRRDDTRAELAGEPLLVEHRRDDAEEAQLAHARPVSQQSRLRRLCRGMADANMCSMYAELHAHSAFSFLDGASLPDELARPPSWATRRWR